MEHLDYLWDQAKLTERIKLLEELHEKKLLLRSKIAGKPFLKPINIEVLGTPGAGKTRCINALYEFFRRGGFNVYLANDFIDRYISPSILDADEIIQKQLVEKLYMLYLQVSNCTAYDIVLYDEGILDRYVWLETLCRQNKLSALELENYKELIAGQRLDYCASLICNPNEAERRALAYGLALESKFGYSIPDYYLYNVSLKTSAPFIGEHSYKSSLYETDVNDINNLNIKIANEILDMGLNR